MQYHMQYNLKGHKICFQEKIKWSSWKLTTFRKNFQIKEISKIIKSKNFSTTEILRKHSTEKIIPVL